jgi:hypothetical protein
MSQTRTDRLSDLAYKDNRARWMFYLWTMGVAISYGCLNTIVLDRPESTVTYEVLLICLLAHVVFLSYYLLANRSVIAAKKKRGVAKPEPTIPATSTWRFPRFLPYSGVVAAMILVTMARANPNYLQAKILGFALTVLPSSVVGTRVPTILDGARDHDIIVGSSVLLRNGLKFIKASGKHPDAWSAAKATLDYRSFLNKQLDLAPKVANARSPGAGFPYMFGISSEPNPGQSSAWVARIKVEGSASPEASARLEMLSSPQPRGSGAELISIEGKADTIVLDGAYWKNVIVKDAEVKYDGGPVKLDNVYFVNCEFIVPPTPGGRAFAGSILRGGATNFVYGKIG